MPVHFTKNNPTATFQRSTAPTAVTQCDLSPNHCSSFLLFCLLIAILLVWWLLYLPIMLACLVIQSCPALCNSMHYSPPGSSVHGILQARTLEWVAISSSRRSSQPGTELSSPLSLALAGGFFTTEPLGKPCIYLLFLFSTKLWLIPLELH